MPTMQEIALDILQRAKAAGVNPHFALGIASREGLIPRVINSPTFGNPDVHGYSYGPWQLYSGSPTPGAVAGGGQASQFMAKYGVRPSAENWRQQNDFAINLLARLNPQQQAATWHAIGNAGGHAAITNMGANFANRLGLTNFGGAPMPLGTTTPGGAPVAQGGGDTNFSLGPPPDDQLPQVDNAQEVASEVGGTGGGPSISEYYDTPIGDMGGEPLADPVSQAYATTEQQRRMGIKSAPTDMQLADLFQNQNINLQKIGAAKNTPSLRKMGVG